MTLSPRDDEPDDHVSRAEASDAPSEPVEAPGEPPATTPDDDSRAEPAAGSGSADEPEGVRDETTPEDERAAAEAAAWAAIVANYGEAPAWEEPTGRPSGAGRGAPHPDHPAGRGRRRPEPPTGPEPVSPPDRGREPDPDPDVVRGPDERFVPPPPPPLPRTSPARGLAWFGLLGVPSVVLVLLVAGVSLPSWVALGFTAWFVGGFGFLVAGMRSDHDDPDDGAVV